jgi:hypothetical protein
LKAAGVTAGSLVPHFNFDDMHRISASLLQLKFLSCSNPLQENFLKNGRGAVCACARAQ